MMQQQRQEAEERQRQQKRWNELWQERANAHAKNSSTVETKARTLHNASAMSVQHMSNDRLRPG